jgi:hypothetical protein
MLGGACSPCCQTLTFASGSLGFTGPLADWNCCGFSPGAASPPGYSTGANPSPSLLTPSSSSYASILTLGSTGDIYSETIRIEVRAVGSAVQMRATFFGPRTDGISNDQRAVVVYEKSLESVNTELASGFVSFLSTDATSASGTSNQEEPITLSHVGKICFRISPPLYEYRSRGYSVSLNARTSNLTVDNHNASQLCDRPACRTSGGCTGPEPAITLFMSERLADGTFTFGADGTGECSTAGSGGLFFAFGIPVARQSTAPVFFIQSNYKSVVTKYCFTTEDQCSSPPGGSSESTSLLVLARRSSLTVNVSAPSYQIHLGCFLTFESDGVFQSGSVLFPKFGSRAWPSTCRPIDFNVLPSLDLYDLGPLSITITRNPDYVAGSGCDVLP